MELNDHLFYFDITNYCTLGCDFCMYSTNRELEREDLVLDEQAEENLSGFINHERTAHIIISAEGEPFNNYSIMRKILGLSGGDNNFQIITNGSWFNGNAENKLSDLSSLASEHGDKYSLRLSMDSFHAEKMPMQRYSKFFEIVSKKDFSNELSFAIRSVVEDRQFMQLFLSEIFTSSKIDYELVDEGSLDQKLLFSDVSVPINYKNIVRPVGVSAFPLIDYVDALEQKYAKVFTFGNLKSSRAEKGLDITAKPNGDVFFYGIETMPVGNLFSEHLTTEKLESMVQKDELINALYTKPFKQVITEISKNPFIDRQLAKINNPYWVVKELYPIFKEEFESALCIGNHND